MTIKQEPEWMIEEEYAPSQLYKEDSNVAYTEYEIKPYYDSDIDFDYYKCKVGILFLLFFFDFIFFFLFCFLFYSLILILDEGRDEMWQRIINNGVLEKKKISLK